MQTRKLEVKPKEMLNMETVEVRVIGKKMRTPIIKNRVKLKPSMWDNMILKWRQVTAQRVRTAARNQEGRSGKEEVKTSGSYKSHGRLKE